MWREVLIWGREGAFFGCGGGGRGVDGGEMGDDDVNKGREIDYME